MKQLLAALAILINLSATAQFSQAARDSINKLTQEDFQQILDQLNIKRNEMRPGASGNPNDANAANRFEEKVNQYKLPDPLILKNGKKITTAADGGINADLRSQKILTEKFMEECRKIISNKSNQRNRDLKESHSSVGG